MTGSTIGTIIFLIIVAAILIAVGVWLMNWLYRRSSKEISFVRTGFGGQRVLLGQAGPDLVGAGHVGQRQRVGHRRHVLRGDLVHLPHETDDLVELTGELVELGVGQLDAGEHGDVGDLVAGQRRHGGQSRARR